MIELPETVTVSITSNSSVTEGYLLRLTLGTDHKNDYSFILGPTNSDGKTSISKSELLTKAEATLKLALMDFAPLKNSFNGQMHASIMQSNDIQKAVKACELYGPNNYPTGYINKLHSALTKPDIDHEVTISVESPQT